MTADIAHGEVRILCSYIRNEIGRKGVEENSTTTWNTKKTFPKSIVSKMKRSPLILWNHFSTFDIKWKLTELARSKYSRCFHSILKLNHAHSISLFGWLGDSGCTSHSKQHDACHHCKAHASLHSQRLSFIVSNCRLFPWLSLDPYRPNLSYLLVSTPTAPKRHYLTHTVLQKHICFD